MELKESIQFLKLEQILLSIVNNVKSGNWWIQMGVVVKDFPFINFILEAC